MAQWKRAGPITQRSEDRNLALLIIFLQFESTKMLNQSTAIYTLISLASSFVVQANSADLNQTPLLIRVTTVYFQNVLSEFGQSENRPLSQIYSCPMKTHHSSDVHSYVAYQTLCKIVLFIFIIYPGDKRPERSFKVSVCFSVKFCQHQFDSKTLSCLYKICTLHCDKHTRKLDNFFFFLLKYSLHF